MQVLIACTGTDECTSAGSLPPTSDDCDVIFDAITILNGSVCTSLAQTEPGVPSADGIHATSDSAVVRGRGGTRADGLLWHLPRLLRELLSQRARLLLALSRTSLVGAACQNEGSLTSIVL